LIFGSELAKNRSHLTRVFQGYKNRFSKSNLSIDQQP
jgi:hypothetical protein